MSKAGAIPLLLFGVLICRAADAVPDLLSAAKKGQTEEVRALLERGVPVESRDKDGRTALMMAAEHGHAETVALLLAKGARPETRDREGYDAFGLAFLNPSKGRDKVLSLLPPKPRVRMSFDATWNGGNARNSCFLTPAQVMEEMQAIHPDALVVAAVRDVARTEDGRLIELSATEGDMVLHLRVRPGTACVQQQSADNLRMEVDARLTRPGSDAALWEKTFGGGLKGMKAKAAANPTQYRALFEEWAKADAGAVYSGVISALLKQ